MRAGGRGARGAAAVLAVTLATAAPTAAMAAGTRLPTDEPGGSATAAAEAEPNQPEPVTDAERAAAIASPAIVAIEVRWEGEIRDRYTGALIEPGPLIGTHVCTGVGVGSDGYLLTTAACLTSSSVLPHLLGQLVATRVADGRAKPEEADALLAELLATAMIGDGSETNPPERSVLVRRAVTDDDPMPATVTMLDPDVALLHIARPNQPILPLADDVEPGEEVITLECGALGGRGVVGVATPASTEDPDPGPVRPRARLGVVADTEPYLRVTPAEDSPAAQPGGVVLNHDAELVGLVDAVDAEGAVLVDASVVRAALAQTEIENELGPVDRDYRAGLEAYYNGRYTESIERFDAVLAIIPAHRQAHDFRAEAQSLREVQGGGPEPPEDVSDQVRRWTNGRSQTLVAIGVLIAILFFVFHRRRTPHPAALPGPEEPGSDLPDPPEK